MFEDGMTVEQPGSTASPSYFSTLSASRATPPSNSTSGSAFGRPSQNNNNNSSSSFGQLTQNSGSTNSVSFGTSQLAWNPPLEARPPAPSHNGEASRQRSMVIEKKVDQLIEWSASYTQAIQWLIDAQKAHALPVCRSREDTRGHDYVEQPGLMECQRCGKKVGIMPVAF